MPKVNRTKRGHYPAPVYEATLADGSVERMSFWSQEGKSLDFARGRRLLAVSSCPVEDRGYNETGHRRGGTNCGSLDTYPPREVVDGYVIHNGARVHDPHFAPTVVTIKPKRKVPSTNAELAAALELARVTIKRLARTDSANGTLDVIDRALANAKQQTAA